jgi:hypothetical protein
MQFLIVIVISFLSFSDYGQKETQPDWAELRPILERLKLTATTSQIEGHDTTYQIEKDDAKVYGPASGITIFLRTSYFTEGRIRPRYWMRVEDYSTAKAASKRAAEYSQYIYLGRKNDITKNSSRLWAVARGKRVYALTTDAFMFKRISLPGELKADISKLPEK